MHDSIEASVDPIGIIAPMVHATFCLAAASAGARRTVVAFRRRPLRLQMHTLAKLQKREDKDLVVPQPDDLRSPIRCGATSAQVGPDEAVRYLFFTRQIQDALFQTPGSTQGAPPGARSGGGKCSTRWRRPLPADQPRRDPQGVETRATA